MIKSPTFWNKVSLSTSGFTLYYGFRSDLFFLHLVGANNGWIGLGLGYTNVMSGGADIIQLYDNSGTLTVIDSQALAQEQPYQDAQQDYTIVSGSIDGSNNWDITLVRYWNTNDP